MQLCHLWLQSLLAQHCSRRQIQDHSRRQPCLHGQTLHDTTTPGTRGYRARHNTAAEGTAASTPQQKALPATEPATTPQQKALPATEPATTPEQKAHPPAELATTPQQKALPVTELATTPQQNALPVTELATTPEQKALAATLDTTPQHLALVATGPVQGNALQQHTGPLQHQPPLVHQDTEQLHPGQQRQADIDTLVDTPPLDSKGTKPGTRTQAQLAGFLPRDTPKGLLMILMHRLRANIRMAHTGSPDLTGIGYQQPF